MQGRSPKLYGAKLVLIRLSVFGHLLSPLYEGRTGPVEPATLAKVKAPLEEGCCGWVGPQV